MSHNVHTNPLYDNKTIDVDNKQGFLEATVKTALRGEDLRKEFLEYLFKVMEKEAGALGEAF